MSTDIIEDLLHEVADAVEPGNRLDAIRAATADSGRRTRRGWWAAGGVGLVAASAVAALALSTGGGPQQIGPASPGPSTAAPTSATDIPVRAYGPVEVFLVGDTARGPRLYRELGPVTPNDVDDRLATAVGLALGRDQDGSPHPPLDPDYRVPWPAGTSGTATVDRERGEIEISVGGDPQDDLRFPGSLSDDEAGLAIESLVRTAQTAVGEQLPVRFLLFGEPADRLLGVDTSRPLAARPDTDVLPGVSLAEPSEGIEIREGTPLRASGFGLSEGDVRLEIERDGVVVLTAEFDVTVEDDGELPSFSVNWVSDRLTPGDYVVVASMPGADGTVDTDTRGITIVP